MTRDEFVKTLFDRAAREGFTACEVYYQNGSSFSVSVFGGEIRDYSSADAAGLSFRALIGGKMGYASTEALDLDAIDLLIDGARENAKLIESPDEQFLFPGSSAYAGVENHNPAIDEWSAAKKIELCKEFEKRTLAADPRIRQVGVCGVFSESSEVEIVNTLGLRVSHRANLIGGYVEPVAAEGDRTNTGFAMFYEGDPAKIDLDAAVEKGVREAVDGLNAESVAAGEYRVLLRNDCAATMLSTFSGVFSADRAQKGLSLLNGREGEKIAAECVTIVDDPHMPGQPASTPFDAEGVATYPKKVVERGVLKTLLHNLKTANKQGVKTTASASKSGYASSVSVAPTNFLIEPTNEPPETMLDRLSDGLFITDVQDMHSGADPISGDFSLSAKGYLVEHGKIARAVNQITVGGNFFKLLNGVEAVGGDLKFAFPGSSGFASPSILIRALSVAGK